jgi:hypothetical protein
MTPWLAAGLSRYAASTMAALYQHSARHGRKEGDMQAAITKLKTKIETARARLLTALDGLDETAWEWRPEDGRWPIRLTMAHVGSAQWDHLEVIRSLLAGEPATIPDFDLDAWNASSVAKRDDWTPVRILADLADAQQETMVLLDTLDDDQLLVTGTHPALDKVSVGQVFKVIALHDGLHRRDVLRLRREMGIE